MSHNEDSIDTTGSVTGPAEEEEEEIGSEGEGVIDTVAEEEIGMVEEGEATGTVGATATVEEVGEVIGMAAEEETGTEEVEGEIGTEEVNAATTQTVPLSALV